MSDTIDTLEIFNRFQKVSFTPEQAQELSTVISDVVEGQLVTKRDLRELELRMTHDLTVKLYGMTGLLIAAVGLMIKFL